MGLGLEGRWDRVGIGVFRARIRDGARVISSLSWQKAQRTSACSRSCFLDEAGASGLAAGLAAASSGSTGWQTAGRACILPTPPPPGALGAQRERGALGCESGGGAKRGLYQLLPFTETETLSLLFTRWLGQCPVAQARLQTPVAGRGCRARWQGAVAGLSRRWRWARSSRPRRSRGGGRG